MKTNFKKLGLFGIIGGIIYVIANALVYFGTGDIFANPDPFWLKMSSVRIALSEVLIIFGSAGYLCGFISLYAMVKENCDKFFYRNNSGYYRRHRIFLFSKQQ